MTREKALLATVILNRIETYEAIIDEISRLNSLEELVELNGEIDLEDELIAVVQARLNKSLKELEKL